MYSQLLLKEFKNYENDFYFTTPSYADSALSEYFYHKHIAVFGAGSKHARQDDIITDFKVLNGKNIIILRKLAPSQNEYADFFQNIETDKITIKEANFYFVKGYVFNYENYRKEVLMMIKEKYYNIPNFLPMPKGKQYFLDKYSFF
jgi:hypothetical protein